nr:toll-like receptor 5 isoform X2 [Columba livia]
MLRQQLVLVIGISLASDICASRSCYSEAQVSLYHFCNLTDIPLVPKDTVKLLLAFNYIRQVTATSFPLLEHLLLLEIGAQYVYPVTIGKGAFRNLPNLRVLDLGFNNILQLDLDAFVGLQHLSVLRLFQNNLGDSILEDRYFQDLSSLEEVDLSGNQITKLHPHPLFYNLTVLKTVNLKFNTISNLCESNLTSFRGKHFIFFSLSSNQLYKTDETVWAKCQNPFRNITFDSLDLSGNGWSTEKVQYFCAAIKDDLSILNSSITALQPSETPCIWNRTAGAAPPVFSSMKQELQKQNLEAEIYSEGSCEHRHKPQGMLNAKERIGKAIIGTGRTG